MAAGIQKVWLQIVTTAVSGNGGAPSQIAGRATLKPNVTAGYRERATNGSGDDELLLPQPVVVDIVDGLLTYRGKPYVWLKVSDVDGWNWNISFDLTVDRKRRPVAAFNFDLIAANSTQIANAARDPSDPAYYRGVDLATVMQFTPPTGGTPTVQGPRGYTVGDIVLDGDYFVFQLTDPDHTEIRVGPVPALLAVEEAAGSAAAAAASQVAAAGSASSASASASSAAAAASNAATSATGAGTSATAAAGSATAATNSATNAGISASSAASSATAAGTSASGASASASNASASATDAAESASSADESATGAATSASAAAGSASSASTSASNAATSASSASGSATSAGNSATAAAASASLASTKAAGIPPITVSDTAPLNPNVGDVWIKRL